MTRKVATAFERVLPIGMTSKAVALYRLLMRRLDTLPLHYRQSISVTISLLLHLGLLLLLLPSATGLTSLGFTGVGNVDGAGTAVTLADASEWIQPKASQVEAQTTSTEQTPETAATPDTTEAIDDTAKSIQNTDTTSEPKQATTVQAVKSDSDEPSNSVAQAIAGAHGQNGQANTDLWNAIAPCWNRVANKDTLSATLTISFAEDGGLSVPPVIERDPNAPITDRSLQSEAQALRALSECGAYPMVKGQQGVTVQFPSPITSPATSSNGQKATMVFEQ